MEIINKMLMLLVVLMAGDVARAAYQGTVDDIPFMTTPGQACLLNLNENKLHWMNNNRAGMHLQHIENYVYNEMLAYENYFGEEDDIANNKQGDTWFSQRTGMSTLIFDYASHPSVEGMMCCCKAVVSEACDDPTEIVPWGVRSDERGDDGETPGASDASLAQCTYSSASSAEHGVPFQVMSNTGHMAICGCPEVWDRGVSAMVGNSWLDRPYFLSKLQPYAGDYIIGQTLNFLAEGDPFSALSHASEYMQGAGFQAGPMGEMGVGEGEGEGGGGQSVWNHGGLYGRDANKEDEVVNEDAYPWGTQT